MQKSLTKIIAVIMIVGLNWTALSAVINTFAYYNDTEESRDNAFTAGTLDFSLTSPGDFSPEITPAATSSRSINLTNDGILGFDYNVSATNTAGVLCDYLTLNAKLEGSDVYTGSVAGFNYNAGRFSATTTNWQFIASLTSNDSSLQNQTCAFDFVFDGAQIEGLGFSDQETISNTVTSDTWAEPTPPTTSSYSPIIDSYVDEKSPGSNKGNKSELKIRSKNPGPENRRTFIRFDFYLPSGTTINSAYLKLYMKAASSDSRIYEASRVLASWKERDPDGIDWDNQPSVYATPTDFVPSGDANPKWLLWDVTSNVQAMVNGTYSNYGWRLSDNIESATTSYEAKFHSRESSTSDKRPILEITFTPPEVTTAYLVINEVYYDVGSGMGSDPKNEWIEIYNPTNSPIDISGWKISDNNSTDTIPASTPIPAKGFAVITGYASTWSNWTIPSEVVKIVLDSNIGGGLRDDGDQVILKNASNVVIDAMSYGNDTSQFTLPLSGKGKSLARIVKGYDTDSATDWIINASPNPGTNPSIDGVETITFTYQGVEFLGSEPAPTEEGESNDLPEEEDLIIEETLTITEETVDEEITTNEEASTGEDLIIPEGDNENETAGETTEDVIEEEDPSANEEVPTDETPAIEEQPATEDQPAAVPDNSSSNPDGAGESVSDGGIGDGGGDTSVSLDSSSPAEGVVSEGSGDVGDTISE